MRVYRGRCATHEAARKRIRNQQPEARAHRSTAYYRMRARVLAYAGYSHDLLDYRDEWKAFWREAYGAPSALAVMSR